MVLRAILSHYRRHPLHLLSLWVILMLATALWSGVWSLTQQARDSMRTGEAQLSGRQQVVRSDGAPVTVEDFVTLRRQGLCVMPWLEVDAGEGRGRLVGIDPLAMACAGNQETGAGTSLDGEPFVDIHRAAKLAEAGHRHRLRLLLDAPEDLSLPPQWQRQPDPAALSTGELADSFLLNLDALGVLVVLVSALLIRSVYTLGLAQRREGLALLERYGVTRGRLQRLLLLELLILGLSGIVPGYLLGQLLADGLAGGFGEAMGSLFGTPLLRGGDTFLQFGVTAILMLLVTFWCGLELLRPRGKWVTGNRWLHVTTVVLMMGVGGVLVFSGERLVAVFAGTGMIMAATGLATPYLMNQWPKTSSGTAPLGLWRRRETGVLIRRLSLPLVALQLAVATVIAVQALVTTFEDTFQQWLGQRLAGDLFVEVPAGKRPEDVAGILSFQPSIVEWHPVIRGQVRLPLPDGNTIALDLMATDTGSGLIREWELLQSVPDPWQAVAGGGVLINEQLARRHQLEPGDTLTLQFPEHRLSPRVAGVYSDYGRPAGEVLLDHDELPASFVPGFQSVTIALESDATTSDRQSLERDLERVWSVADIEIRDTGTIRELANRIFDQTFLLTRAISLLTLVLAGAALLMTGWVALASRRWYVHLLAVWGLRRRERLGLLVRLGMGLMFRVWLAALPLALLLTWVLVARINPVAFGWSLPMAIYPGYWLQLLVVMVIIGLVLGSLAARVRRGAPVTMPVLTEGGER
ncbi:putative ABC transport system permease protein [Marinobacter daqiaonensis]|uniref:Putative ABC transport system permease protein n=1 Tax=Marinobacter daqiaonensis TaxID=650891 RepID=A0A1I6I6I5_9GAMM|nr:ABC transporter permease [Marinobacter daqiaonensis]SFR62301.1 putative ABC transport system permease protein [Marinobacter daqiaonensis]